MTAGQAAPGFDSGSCLNVQRCNTDCQDAFTECVLRCDADVPCEKQCLVTVEGCHAECERIERERNEPKPPPESEEPAEDGEGSESQ